MAADINDIRKNGLSWGSALSLGADALATAVPFVPAGAGAAFRAGRLGKAARWDIDGGALSADRALDEGLRWLGEGYSEIGKAGSGVFRSADNSRQFRISRSNLEGTNPHVNFEAIAEDGKTILENSHVRIREQ